MLLRATFFCFVLSLPPFSKDINASGFAPTLSINQFESNKCGIFSRTVCIPLVCLWTTDLLSHMVFMNVLGYKGFFFFSLNNLSTFTFLQWTLAASYLSNFQAQLYPPHSQVFCSTNFHISQTSFSHFQNVFVGELKKSARSSFRTTGFYLWHNKDAPQSLIWVLLLIGQFFLLGWWPVVHVRCGIITVVMYFNAVKCSFLSFLNPCCTSFPVWLESVQSFHL